ncbi:hypothetical protein D3C83_215090 [compost metagenome]
MLPDVGLDALRRTLDLILLPEGQNGGNGARSAERDAIEHRFEPNGALRPEPDEREKRLAHVVVQNGVFREQERDG